MGACRQHANVFAAGLHFFSKAPSDTDHAGGLAVFAEIVSFNSHPARLRPHRRSIRAIALAEQGGRFSIFQSTVRGGRSREEAYTATMRVFRGSLPDAGPFTSDLPTARDSSMSAISSVSR